ncbi:HepT-like ribonuclease domain-containing protein [Rhodopseudomonas palustris]|uniref:HepT-like ribonuclease domain-containing protein n=1 Tax=Rhodopseudomonas palustris TaxID=1076 RepID=UPI001403CEF3|nr:HepT-like ribonuclease domain-containing protein [Rhodopseudomonas palustris]
MSRRSVLDWLNDIIAWGERLEGHLAGVSYEGFLNDPKTQDAAAKCAEAIGVAANELAKLDPTLEARFPELQLGLAYRARNKLSHGYYMVEQQIVWTTVTISIPQTVAAARRAKYLF